jgi:hypothetical protein
LLQKWVKHSFKPNEDSIIGEKLPDAFLKRNIVSEAVGFAISSIQKMWLCWYLFLFSKYTFDPADVFRYLAHIWIIFNNK